MATQDSLVRGSEVCLHHCVLVVEVNGVTVSRCDLPSESSSGEEQEHSVLEERRLLCEQISKMSVPKVNMPFHSSLVSLSLSPGALSVDDIGDHETPPLSVFACLEHLLFHSASQYLVQNYYPRQIVYAVHVVEVAIGP